MAPHPLVMHLLWSLVPSTQVMEMRHVESQVLQEDACSEQGSVMGHPDPAVRRATAPPHAGAGHHDMYSFNLSFEELSNVGLDEPPRQPIPPWTVSTSCFLLKPHLFLVLIVHRSIYCLFLWHRTDEISLHTGRIKIEMRWK